MLDQIEIGGSRQSQDRRRQQLIDATVRVIAEHGLSNVTLSKVAGLAGLFSKQATDKLREVFENLFKTEEATKRGDKLGTQQSSEAEKKIIGTS